MTLLKRLRAHPIVLGWGQLLLGCLIAGIAYPLFLTPNRIAPGGLTGVATILYATLHLPVGMTSLAMNIPLFIIGYRTMGRSFALRSLVATVLFSVAIDGFSPLPPLTEDPLLGAVFGGVLSGIGFGLIMRGGATTGGTDMIARMVHHRFPTVSVGMFLFAIDCCVVLAAWVTLGSNEALYALITIFIQSRMIDVVLVGLTSNKACFIMTAHWEQVTDALLHQMDRGVTLLQARGAWTRAERPVVLCVISRQELPKLKEIVSTTDEEAFMFVTEAFEALGEGFSQFGSD